jgi:hypothetical protein
VQPHRGAECGQARRPGGGGVRRHHRSGQRTLCASATHLIAALRGRVPAFSEAQVCSTILRCAGCSCTARMQPWGAEQHHGCLSAGIGCLEWVSRAAQAAGRCCGALAVNATVALWDGLTASTLSFSSSACPNNCIGPGRHCGKPCESSAYKPHGSFMCSWCERLHVLIALRQARRV